MNLVTLDNPRRIECVPLSLFFQRWHSCLSQYWSRLGSIRGKKTVRIWIGLMVNTKRDIRRLGLLRQLIEKGDRTVPGSASYHSSRSPNGQQYI